jgi:hypothetical protein
VEAFPYETFNVFVEIVLPTRVEYWTILLVIVLPDSVEKLTSRVVILGIVAVDTTASVFVESVEPVRVENVPDLVTKDDIVMVELICALLMANVLL